MTQVPGLLTYLPHLLGRPEALTPAIHVTQGRRDVTVVMGLPTVRREVQNYLVSTLKNLVDCMSEAEREETLIVVFIAEVSLKNLVGDYIRHAEVSRGGHYGRFLYPLLRHRCHYGIVNAITFAVIGYDAARSDRQGRD